MLQGMKQPCRKGSSESILASSLAGDIARYRLKRRQRYRRAGLLGFEKRGLTVSNRPAVNSIMEILV
jgi:hypothetical protein